MEDELNQISKLLLMLNLINMLNVLINMNTTLKS